MVRYLRKITIIKLDKPNKISINEEIQWFSNTLGLFGERDKEKSRFRIFVELLRAAKVGKGLSSEKISEKTQLSRATVIHHLRFLIEEGLVRSYENRYFLRVHNLGELVNVLREDVHEIFDNLNKIAESIDRELRLK